MSTATRQTAEERREAVLAAAAHEFAHKGLHGGSTDAIAKAAGISQPYLFRLFGTKKELYLATTARKMAETVEAFRRAVDGKSGQEALRSAGDSYTELIVDRERLLLMLQCFAECDDADIRASVRGVWRDLMGVIDAVPGLTEEEVSVFFAKGMLLNVLNAMHLFDEPTGWGDRLIAGCRAEEYG